jgi:hypothetical protein
VEEEDEDASHLVRPECEGEARWLIGEVLFGELYRRQREKGLEWRG